MGRSDNDAGIPVCSSASHSAAVCGRVSDGRVFEPHLVVGMGSLCEYHPGFNLLSNSLTSTVALLHIRGSPYPRTRIGHSPSSAVYAQ